jgi:Raf kinase inhibitor-like YbhB/YbcL family protein
MRLTSPAFEEGRPIPRKYGRNGENVSPPLDIHDVPVGTQSLVLIMVDPDIPQVAKEKLHIQEWDHWCVYDIPPTTHHIPEGKNPAGIIGINTNGEIAYGGPRPPDKEHRYFFHAYALSGKIGLEKGATIAMVKEKMNGQILGHAQLMGTFKP